MREKLEGDVWGGGDNTNHMLRGLLADAITKWLVYGWSLDGSGFGITTDPEYNNARQMLRDLCQSLGISPQVGEKFAGKIPAGLEKDLITADMQWAEFYSALLRHLKVSEIVNLTQHTATAEQVEAGAVEPAEKAAVQAVLTFDAIPSVEEIQQRALLLAAIAAQSGCKKAMIGGAPFFMSALESALKAQGIAPVYAFSQRESVESIQSDGSVVKTNVFKHVGFVEAINGINS